MVVGGLGVRIGGGMDEGLEVITPQLKFKVNLPTGVKLGRKTPSP